jgi:8-oxo-dGTP diphosphatase
MRDMAVGGVRAITVRSGHCEAAAARDPRLVPGPMVALAVVTSPAGVLVGRRRDGVPPWVFPGGKVEPGESPAHAAARECFEETGLEVRVEHEIGRRNHPVTGRHVVYLACTVITATAVRTPRSEELVELRWLDRDQVEDLMPDLNQAVCRYLCLRFGGS